MEMHSRASLRTIHGIETRPIVHGRSISWPSYDEYYRIAAIERGKVFRKVFSTAAMALVTAIRTLIIEPISRTMRYRRDIRLLMQMSDSQLKDIGITRGDIGRSVRFGRSGDR